MVAEISSFQLDLARGFTPDIAVLLNISPDHLDRYAGMADYCRSKWSIFKHQTSAHTAIINANITDLCPEKPETASLTFKFSSNRAVPVHQGAYVETRPFYESA